MNSKKPSVATTVAPADGASGGPSNRRLPWWAEAGVLVLAAIVLAVIVKTLFVQAFYIPSESMVPTLNKNDRILVAKPPYWFGGSPSRGDVIVFKDPGGWLGNSEQDQTTGFESLLSKVGLYPAGGHLVKRVIGVAGDRVVCCDDQGRVTVNGYPLKEDDYIAPRSVNILCDGPENGPCAWDSGVIPKGKLFVMGDNRGDSADSVTHLCLATETDCHDYPFVTVDDVVGKAEMVAWPRSHLDWLGRPADFDKIPDPK